jgi:protocatechuate 3,4-dioxygenase beta subunit
MKADASPEGKMRCLLFGSVIALVLSMGFVHAQTTAGGAQVAGRVTDADSKEPLAGVRVTVMPTRPAASSATLPRWTTPLTGVTDETGRFVLDGVTPGRHRVNLQKQGYAFDPVDAPIIEVRGGQAMAVELTLRRGGVITGRILDERGEPLSDVRVIAVRRISGGGNRPAALGGPGMVTNDLGEFRIAGLPAGEYTLMAASQPSSPFGGAPTHGSTAWAPTYYPGTTNQAEAQTVTVSHANTVNGLEFRLISAPAFRVSGIVVDEAGKPVDEAVLMLRPVRGNSSPGTFVSSIPGRSQADGTFVIGGVIAGTYAISASPVIRSPTGNSTFVSTLTMSQTGSPPEQQIAVDGADVTGIKVIVPRPRQ